MIKSNLKIKEDLKITDKINLVETIVDYYFTITKDEDENKVITYTPYLKEVGQFIGIAQYAIEGIEFNINDNIYNLVLNDPDILSLVRSVLKKDWFSEIMNDVIEIVEYKKSEILAKTQNESNSIIAHKIFELIELEQENYKKNIETIDNLNEWLREQKELNSLITPEMQKKFAETLDVNSIMDTMIKKYGESELYKKNVEVIEASQKIRKQDQKIVELQNILKNKSTSED